MKGMISNDEQRGSVAFRPHARLIRLLGDELISDEVMAVVELVKNGYDADASRILITLHEMTDVQSGSICIRDDGDGMDLFTLLHIWMEPATTNKRKRHRSKQRTGGGRILLGEKGVGRFAADKLGAELMLVTRDRTAEKELVLQVSWNQYDGEKYLEEVTNTWFAREPVEFPDGQHGTLLVIRSLRTAWTQEMVGRLYNGLSRLVSPFMKKRDFVIEIISPEFPTIQGKVVNHLLETAPYRFSGTVNQQGYFFSDQGQESSVDLCALSPDHFIVSGNRRPPLCGQFHISLNVWDLDLLLSGKGTGIDRTLREAIKSFCGVSVYRDGFRIWPYGEKDDDWLELNQRRVNNPTLRISNNQIIGFIEITHEENPDLRDRTSREGLIDTEAFFDLKVLVQSVLSLLEAARFNQRHQVTLSRSLVEEEKDDLLHYLSGVSRRVSDSVQERSLQSTAREIERLYRQRLEQERARYDRVSALAGVGMAAELLNDALTKEVNSTTVLLRILQGEVQVNGNSQVQQAVELLARHMGQIYEMLDLTGPFYQPQRQLNETVDVRAAVYDVLAAMKLRLNEDGVRVSLRGDVNLAVRISRGFLMQAIMIIIANGLEAMKEAAISEPSLEMTIVSEKEFQGVLVANNGPAIPDQYRKLIFEPAFSMRKGGRGLGLHVARDLLAACSCGLDLVEGVTSSGTCFRIRFDRRRTTGL